MGDLWTTIKNSVGRPFRRKRRESTAVETRGSPIADRRRARHAEQIDELCEEIRTLQRELVAEIGPPSKAAHPDVRGRVIRARDLRYKVRLLEAEQRRNPSNLDRSTAATSDGSALQERPSAALARAVEAAIAEAIFPDDAAKAAFKTAASDLLSPVRDKHLRAVRALKELGLRQCGPLLTAALDYRDEELRLACLQALVDLREAGASAALEGFVAHPNHRFRVAALRGLQALDSESLVPSCLRGLADPHAQVRRTAVALLGQQRRPETAPALAVMLRDEDEGVRLAAAEALGAIGSEQGVYTLIRALEDPELEVRVAAKAALAKTLSVPIVLKVDQKQYEEKPASLLQKVDSLLGWWANARVETWARSIPLIREYKEQHQAPDGAAGDRVADVDARFVEAGSRFVPNPAFSARRNELG